MHKKDLYTFIVLTFFVFSLYSQSDTTWNQQSVTGKKEGQWKAYHPNGKLRYKGQFKDGIPYGDFYLYLNNGDLKTILSYRNEQEAFGKHFYGNGDILAQGKYVERKKDSLWVTYGGNNIKLEEGTYNLGEKNGHWITYFPDGTVAERKNYKDDIEEGKYEIFYSNSQLKQEAKFEKGMLEGNTVFYDREGLKILEGTYYRNMRDGDWIHIDEENKKTVLKYDKGELLNPEKQKEIDYDVEEFRENIKDRLEFEDLRGNIKYEKPKKKR